MSNPIICPVCKNTNRSHCLKADQTSGDYQRFDCGACGHFDISNSSMAVSFNASPETWTLLQRAALSHQIRRSSDQSARVLITADWLKRFLTDCRLPTPLQQANNLIRTMGDLMSQSGDYYHLTPATASIVGAQNMERCEYLLAELRDKGLIMMVKDSEAEEYYLSLDGWEKYQQLKQGRAAGNYGFLALKFDDETLDRFLKDVLKPAVKAGISYEMVDMRNAARAGIIDNLLREQIRDAAFVIADLTHDNYGAYWEAGYAEGLGKPVIYMCEKNKFEQMKTHFDTNHSTTVLWEVDNPERFKEELVATLRRSLNLFPAS